MPSITEIIANIKKQQRQEKITVEAKRIQEEARAEREIKNLQQRCKALMTKSNVVEALGELNSAVLGGRGVITEETSVERCNHGEKYDSAATNYYICVFSTARLVWRRDKNISVTSAFHILAKNRKLGAQELGVAGSYSHYYCPKRMPEKISTFGTNEGLKDRVAEAVAREFIKLETSG